jgi:hypothetical protein
MIRITRTYDEIIAITFNGEELQSNGREKWYLPKGLVGDEIINHLPENTIFKICDHNKRLGRVEIPIYIQKISENIVFVNFKDSLHRDLWHGNINLDSYLMAKKKVIKMRAKEFGDISLDHYVDDGDTIHLFFSTKIEAETINLAILLAEQMITEIEDAVKILVDMEDQDNMEISL